jgi:1,4-alpha-glucan branching enzyme
MQNHDQVGNRMFGERISALGDFEKLKLAAGATLLSPYLPLIFMGEEYGEDRPFPYFVSHSDPALQVAAHEERKAEFKLNLSSKKHGQQGFNSFLRMSDRRAVSPQAYRLRPSPSGNCQRLPKNRHQTCG